MELRTTEESIQELSIRYESIRRSPVVASMVNGNESSSSSAAEVLPQLLPTATMADKNQDKNQNEEETEMEMEIEEIVVPTLDDLSTVCESIAVLQNGLLELHPKIERFRTRLGEKDAVTGNPRYGEKTRGRVQTLVDRYTLMETHILSSNNNNNDIMNEDDDGNDDDDDDEETGDKKITTTTNHDDDGDVQDDDSSSVQLIRRLLTQHTRQHKMSMEERAQLQGDERRRHDEASRAAAAEDLSRRQLQDEQRRTEEELRQTQQDALHRRAEEARLRRRRAEAAERAWVDGIQTGPHGVAAQLKILRENSTTSASEFAVALSSLRTIFRQINAKPEEVKFRRIRRNHEQFMQDIGRHPGGQELLIAAGFELGVIDEIPVFLSKEPDLERDMDGWSAWFDLLKQTLEILNNAE
jgi:hypothetical protein